MIYWKKSSGKPILQSCQENCTAVSIKSPGVKLDLKETFPLLFPRKYFHGKPKEETFSENVYFWIT